jgi:hypothetical protein
VIILLSFSNAQKVEIECEFQDVRLGSGPNGVRYSCIVSNVTIFEEDANEVVISGTHFPGLDNRDVLNFEVRNFNVGRQFPLEVFSTFGNLHRAVFTNIGITEVKSAILMESVEYLNIMLTPELTTLHSHAFFVARNLRELYLTINGIEHIHRNAFIGLHRLEQLDLRNNRIKYLHDNVLAPMRMLQGITISHNQLTIIRSKQFENNPLLGRLTMHANQINAVERTFMQHSVVWNVQLSLNQCTNSSFFLAGFSSFETFMRQTEPCFKNFDNLQLEN